VFEVRARARVSLERVYVQLGRREWTVGVFEVRTRARVSLELEDVHGSRREWTFGVFEVRTRERVSLGLLDVHESRREWTFGVFEVRARARMSRLGSSRQGAKRSRFTRRRPTSDSASKSRPCSIETARRPCASSYRYGQSRPIARLQSVTPWTTVVF